jgi:uncharacterized membrane protein YkvA (DUF1232 family)
MIRKELVLILALWGWPGGTLGMAPGDERRRYFLVTAGRTGSTLLAAILADAGADFALPVPGDWDVARGGELELPEIRDAANRFRLAFERSARRPAAQAARWLWTYHRSRGKRSLKSSLRKAVYVKAVNLDLAIPYSVKAGYFPCIIVSYRAFGPQALSFSQMLSDRSAESLAQDYDRAYRNAVLLLHAYGGCVVNYNELIDHQRTEWAAKLAEVTGLAVDAILASRARRVTAARTEEIEIPVLYPSTDRTFEIVDALSRRALPPSPQALRNWAGKARARPNPGRREDGVSVQSYGAACRRWMGRLVREARMCLTATVDRRVPWYARLAAGAMLITYYAAPIDPIPNRIPILGHLDDALIASLAIGLFVWMIPAAVRRQLRADLMIRQVRDPS